ncbi:MAG: hypothetical protein NTW87_32270 [Planctomycetota bacterium]|nr:hypothetical protein [Planctomycetota bacterium]
MAERRSTPGISHAEIKAGVFLTFCLALFIAMLFVLGKFGRAWHGRQELRVVFARVNAIRRESLVRYNGMELGHVKQVRILRVDQPLLSRLPPLSRRDLPHLPLTDDERDELRQLPEQGLDAILRDKIANRTVVLLVLDVLRENDTRRFRIDDEYRVTSSLMGDSAVEIRTGRGEPVSMDHDRLFLGLSGDMYTDLGKSISQVKDVLASMAEIVGGDVNRDAIRGQLHSFESYTARIDSAADSMATRLPNTWKDVDARLEETGKTLTDFSDRIKKIQPSVDEAMDSARKSITDTRTSFADSIGSLQEKVRTFRKDAGTSLADWRTRAAEYRESVPEKVRSAREWSERITPTVDKVDSFLTRADDQLDKGVASTRATLGGYLVTAGTLEETTYRLRKWPWSFARKPTPEIAAQQDVVWRHELARRQYAELRGELDRARQGLNATEASDKARAARIEQLLAESDRQLEAGPAEQPRKGRK